MIPRSAYRTSFLALFVLFLLGALPTYAQRFFDGVNSMGPYAWVAPGQPGTRVVGGLENGVSLYVCRASIGGAWYPGKLFGNNCNVGANGVESVNSTYEVLVLNSTEPSFYPQG